MEYLARIDLTWALLDYLTTPRGTLRLVRGLNVLAHDTATAGADVYWATMPDRLGCCEMTSGRILLSTRLLDGWPYAVRRVWSHELGHAICGHSHERVLLWQRRYGELVTPPAWLYGP